MSTRTKAGDEILAGLEGMREHINGNKAGSRTTEPDYDLAKAHALVRETCESWRRSLFVNGPTGHLHHVECKRVAEAIRGRREMLELLRQHQLMWSGVLTGAEERALHEARRELLARIDGKP